MLSHVKTHYFTTGSAYEFRNESKTVKACMLDLGENQYAIIDRKYLKKVMRYKWRVNASGMVVKNKKDASDANDDDDDAVNDSTPLDDNIKSSAYMHLMVYMRVNKVIRTDPNSIAHSNRLHLDNRYDNLVNLKDGENTTMTTELRKVRKDRKLPPEELVNQGFDQYPRHVRYDNSLQRFVIESHPGLQLEEPVKKAINGTRKGSILDKYNDIVHTGIDLDRRELKHKILVNETASEKIKSLTDLKTCIDIIRAFNEVRSQELIPETIALDAYLDVGEHTFKAHLDRLKQIEQMKDPNIVFEENGFVLTKEMLNNLPRHVYFQPPKGARGSWFEYDVKDQVTKERISKRTTSCKNVSLEDKYMEAMEF